LVVGMGGGVVTDLAGFVASTLNRGMPCLHVATTLMAQVDAAIGGKTAVNLAHGKNLVGTFYQPLAVICDVETLVTLGEREVRNGLAEVVKYGLIGDPELLATVENRAPDLLKAEPELMTEVVARCVRYKAAIVAEDERDETGKREWLNYGHTFAHAIEAATGFGAVAHGEAVGLGMVLAARAARLLDRVNDACVMRHERAVETVGLPLDLQLDFEALKSAWAHDKKYRRGVRFVLLLQPESMEAELRERGEGVPESGVEVPDEVLAEAVGSMSR
ncbi:MAG: 3-dehydroquinate synthase, partial [Actinomycetota bacterium]|nr:3-dehydroquinate synthase [Actinomycetota bacterium]